MEISEGEPKPSRETDAFPRLPEEELQHLRELVKDKDVEVQPVGQVGYIAFNPTRPYIAEAPLALLDWDDTAAQTSADKTRCWEELEQMGIDPEVIKYCDKISRVLVGDEEPTYEPELEMRLLSQVIAHQNGHPITLTPELKASLDELREELITNRSLDEHELTPEVKELYDRTRFSSTLYPDTPQTLRELRGLAHMPFNLGILTYGDPSFQFAKVKDVLDGEEVGMVLLTKVRKGKFFQEFIRENPLKNVPMQYTYPETPRNAGVDFARWKVAVVLFDDDPKQVASFKNIAQTEDIISLGVTRVRRKGVKRSDIDISPERLAHEIQPTDTYIDSELFKQSFRELKTRMMEDWVESSVIPNLSHDSRTLNTDVQNIIQSLAAERGRDYTEVIHELLTKAGYDPGNYEENTTLWFNPGTGQQITTKTISQKDDHIT